MSKTIINKNNYYKESGSSVLLSYGKVVVKVDNHRWGLNEDNIENNKLLKEIREQQDKIRFFFATNNSAVLKKYVVDKSSGELDLRLATTISYLCYRLSIDSDEHVLLSVVSNTVSKCLKDCSPLEIRSYIASQLVNGSGVFQLCSDDDGRCPRLFLGDQFVKDYFGQYAILTPATILERQIKIVKDTSTQFGNISPKRIAGTCSVKEYVKELPVLTPQELYDELTKRGYVGQERARKQVCLTVYRFMERLRKIHLHKIPPEQIALPGHTLIMGESGCGKTMLLKELSRICNLIITVTDMTFFSETGFYGRDTMELLTNLLELTNGNVEVAQHCSILVLDELDKLANSTGRTLVSREGVQRSLLSILGQGVLSIPLSGSDHPFRSKKVNFNTANLLVFGLGAFSGFENIAGKELNLGFGSNDSVEQTGGSKSFSDYGILQELTGRFTGGIISMDKLSKVEMKNILINTLPKYQKECQVAGIELSINDDLLDSIVDKSISRGTGARGLVASLEQHLNDLLFNAYSNKGKKKIELAVDGEVGEQMAG
ncbi:MAG: hypothetical protein A2283_03675 [Lentisphaerae bacterium RIFOXYA12_FULL_48_11]|nr:MAG: hypothetical protein A2283_03675 [Lentisphaerae bacterium RIFOXYA12_FULL_48_11]